MGPESRITKTIIKYLRDIGAWAIKKHGSAYMRAGLPDIFALVGGRFLALEMKAPRGVLTPIQARSLADLEAHGALVGVVTSVADVEAII